MSILSISFANKLTGFETFDFLKVLVSTKNWFRSDLGREEAEMDLLQRTLLADQIKPLEMRLDMTVEFHNDNCFKASAQLLLYSVGGHSLCNLQINTFYSLYMCYCFLKTLIAHGDPFYDTEVCILTS